MVITGLLGTAHSSKTSRVTVRFVEEKDTSTIWFEVDGVPYERDDENIVFDEEYDRVGTWDGKSIQFTSSGLKAHKFAVSQL